jgi:hypothetical protein
VCEQSPNLHCNIPEYRCAKKGWKIIRVRFLIVTAVLGGIPLERAYKGEQSSGAH